MLMLREITFYDLTDEVYDEIQKLSDDISKKISLSDKGLVFFEIVAEIVQNAAKANFKEVVRREITFDKSIKYEYEKLMMDFKNRLPKAHIELAQKAKKYNLYIKLEASLSPTNILHLKVINNRPASEQEMSRLDFKIEEAKKYSKLADYYLDNYDDTEGAGLGTALIDISLRAMGFKSFLYRVFNDTANRTIAELIVDLTQNKKDENK